MEVKSMWPELEQIRRREMSNEWGGLVDIAFLVKLKVKDEVKGHVHVRAEISYFEVAYCLFFIRSVLFT